MVCAQPNGGKSFLALWYAIKAQIPTLYISADTDQATTIYRAIAMLTGEKVDDIEETFEQGLDAAYTPELERISNMRFTFEPSPTLEDINLEVLAFEEMWGEPPRIIIVDNLMNVVHGEGNGLSEMQEISQFLHHLARKSGAAVLILHHASENESKAAYPPPRKAVLQKVSQLPEVIITTALIPEENLFRIAVVKNRSGPHDPTGQVYVSLYVIPERMQLMADRQEFQLAKHRYEYA
jgi:hypothetical protein